MPLKGFVYLSSLLAEETVPFIIIVIIIIIIIIFIIIIIIGKMSFMGGSPDDVGEVPVT